MSVDFFWSFNWKGKIHQFKDHSSKVFYKQKESSKALFLAEVIKIER